MSNRALSGFDVDQEATVAELERLVSALKNGDAHLQEVNHSEKARVEADSTESVSLEYVITDDFQGINPVQYETERDS